MNTLIKQVAASAKIDDIHEAVLPIQDILGQDDGGVASMFFSGDYDENWPGESEDWRLERLRDYVHHELSMAAAW